MKSIFSTQNLQTFFLRKYWRLPRRGPPGPPPGPPEPPPGPPSRRPPPPEPPSRRPPPPPCPPPCPPSRASRGADGAAGAAGAAAGAGGAACGCFCSSDIPSYLSKFAPGLGSGALSQTQTLPAANYGAHRRKYSLPALNRRKRAARPAPALALVRVRAAAYGADAA